MRDQFNLSGDFRGAVVNINSAIDRARQSAQAKSEIESFARLEALLQDLSAQLSVIPSGEAEAAEAVAVCTRQLVEAAAADKPNRSVIKSGIQSVLAGGKALASAAPAVVSTVNQIVDLIQNIHDLGAGA